MAGGGSSRGICAQPLASERLAASSRVRWRGCLARRGLLIVFIGIKLLNWTVRYSTLTFDSMSTKMYSSVQVYSGSDLSEQKRQQTTGNSRERISAIPRAW